MALEVLNKLRGLSGTLDNGIDLLTGTAMNEGEHAPFSVEIDADHFTLRLQRFHD